MALDRQSIEKKDFPIGRRGYDREAVDAHLHALADEVDELRRSSRRRGESPAAAASERVRSIVEAAERSAAGIQPRVEDEAREIHAEAAGMLARLDSIENEVNVLIGSLRAALAASAPAARANGADDDGARLIALNMALKGAPREEADRYLAENFELTDRQGLLDDVYSSLDG